MATTSSTAKTSTAKKSTAKSSTAKKSTAKKSTAKKKTTTASTSAKKTSTARTTASTRTRTDAPRPRDRDPRTLATDASYALAGVANEAVRFVRGLPGKLDEFRQEAPARARTLVTETPELLNAAGNAARSKGRERLEHVESRIRDLRDAAAKEADKRLARLEKSFDERVVEGRKVTDELRKDERVNRTETHVKRVLDQASTARSQVKGAVTSLRKTVDVAADAAARAAGDQAGNARSQVKAATTSARKTVQTAVDAGRDIAS